MKKTKITIELKEGFHDQVQDHCEELGISVNKAVENGLVRELRLAKRKRLKK